MNANVPDAMWDMLIKGGGVGGYAVLVFVVYMFSSGKWRTQRECDKVQAEKDKWQEIAIKAYNNNLKLQGTTERAVGVIERAAGVQTENPK